MIEVDIGPNSTVSKFMVDIGSFVDILYIIAFKRIGGKIEDLAPSSEPIYGFTNTVAPNAGTIDLKLSIESKK